MVISFLISLFFTAMHFIYEHLRIYWCIFCCRITIISSVSFSILSIFLLCLPFDRLLVSCVVVVCTVYLNVHYSQCTILPPFVSPHDLHVLRLFAAKKTQFDLQLQYKRIFRGLFYDLNVEFGCSLSHYTAIECVCVHILLAIVSNRKWNVYYARETQSRVYAT